MMDHIKIANSKDIQRFVEDYFSPCENWKTWTHPRTQQAYALTLQTSTALCREDVEACFRLIETTSSHDYQNSKLGWKPRAKRREMQLLDLKYLLVKQDDRVVGFLSFMPTYEDEQAVLYCYEIHLDPAVRGTGLGTLLMQHVEGIAARLPSVVKSMLTSFTRNGGAVAFYNRLGYTPDPYSPAARVLRNGTIVESAYVILSKAVPSTTSEARVG